MNHIITPQDVFDTECWLAQRIADPYQVIAELFISVEAWHLRDVIRRLLQYTISNEIYADKPPCDVMLYMRMIFSTIKSAYALKDKQRSEIVVDEDDMLNPKYFQSSLMCCDAWTDFPRFLSKKEYCNPYLVFRKFFKYQSLESWLAIWRNIIDGALCPHESRYFINEILVYTHLVKLVEAAHLIDVRETVHVGGCLKNRLVNHGKRRTNGHP